MSWAEESSAQWSAIDKLKRDRVRYIEVEVTAVDSVTKTFDAAIEGEQDGVDLAGIQAAEHFLPAVGDIVRLAVAGAQPIHQPTRVGTAYATDPVDGTPSEITKYGQTVGTWSSLTGERTSYIDEDGNQTATSVTTQALNVAGVSFDSLFTRFAKGLLTFWDDGKIQSGIALEFGLLETGYQLDGGRNYRLHVNWHGTGTVNDADLYLRIRQTTNGSIPTTSSTLIAERPYTLRVGTRAEHKFFDVNFQVPAGAGAQYRWLLTLERGPGTAGLGGTVAASYTPSSIHLFDDGPFVLEAGTNTNAGAGSGTTPKVRNVYSAQAAWSRSFRGDGTIRTDATDMVQGYYSVTGDGKAMVGWPDLTTMLSGATIESARVYLQNNSWYYNAGGTLILGTHAQTAAPASFSGTSNRKTVGYGSGPSGQWIDVTSWASEFAAGTTRGFVLGPSGGTNRTYYGRFVGATDTAHADLRPKLEIVYYK